MQASLGERGRGGASGGASLGAGESGGAGSGGASGEGHAHADKKYGRFPLELRAKVDQVRTSSLFLGGAIVESAIYCIDLLPYPLCGLLVPTMRDWCCCHSISPLMAPRFHVFVGAATVRQRIEQHVGRQREQARPYLTTVCWPGEATVHSTTDLRSWPKSVQACRHLPWFRKTGLCS